MTMDLALTLTAATSVGINFYLRRQLRAARRDPVTGLATRALWSAQAARAIRHPHRLVLVLVDGDGVKQVNDRHGHDAGDAVIRALAGRLREWTGHRGAAGRLGGDEFAAYVRLQTGADLVAELDELCASLGLPVPFLGLDLPAGASVGAVRVVGLPVRDLFQAQKAADLAMYAAKAAGGSTWREAELTRAPFPVDRAPQDRLRDHTETGR